MVVAADGPGEQRDRARRGVGHGLLYLVHRQRVVADSDEPDEVHGAKNTWNRHRTRYVSGLWRRRARRTMAAVPMTATVAPAAVIVASLPASRRPTTA